MSEYTLTTEGVSSAASRYISGDAFDAWLAKHDREVAAKTLRDFASGLSSASIPDDDTPWWRGYRHAVRNCASAATGGAEEIEAGQ